MAFDCIALASGVFADPVRRRRSPQVFGLARFRECELLHGRWAMLATLGCIAAEGVTGISWVDAQLAEFDTPSYWYAGRLLARIGYVAFA